MLDPAGGNPIEIEFVTDEAGILALRSAWGDLWRAVPGARLSQSFEWCRTAWEVRAWGPTVRPFIVVVRRQGAVVLVLPLVRERRLGVRLLRPLGPGGTEFSLALTAVDEDEGSLLDRVVERLRQTRAASLLHLPFAPAQSGTGQLIARADRKKLRADIFASWVDWSKVANWDDFLVQRTGSGLVKNYRRQRRKLQELGEVSFSRAEDAESKAVALEWLFEKKAAWLLDKKNSRDHTALHDYREFIRRLSKSSEGVEIFHLKMDSKILSAVLVAPGNGIWELLIITYDSEYSKYSVGRLLTEDIMFLAFSEGRNVDLRIGDDSWKMNWITNDSRVWFADLILDDLGEFYVRLQRVLATLSYYRRLGVGRSLSRVRDRLIMRAGRLKRAPA